MTRALKRWVGRFWLALFGWRVVGEMPPGTPRLVFIAAPHTSNWDLVFMLAIAWSIDVQLNWMGKKSLFRSPFGGLMLWLGGVPVDRRAPQGLVAQVAAEFARRDTLVLAIPPEGTRSLTTHWKSGFYRIAEAARVPIVCGFLDYGRKCGGIGPVVEASGDPGADAARFADFYRTITARHPKRFGPVRFADEPTDDGGRGVNPG
jgi:1-acyl-sn-glycerol-3-phosphate acyltransferase